MAVPLGEYEFELESEYEGEWDGEWEAMAAPSRARRLVDRLRRAGVITRIISLMVNPLPEPAVVPPERPRPAITAPAPVVQGPPDPESEWELNPIRRAYPDGLMEHLGHAAAAVESEAEAEAFIGALVPLAARIIPRAAPAIMRSAPGLIRGLAGAARVLRGSRATRPLVRTLPTVVRRTAADIARQTAGGRPVTTQMALRSMARQTAQVLGSPQRCVQALQRSRALDRQYHRAVASGRPATALGR